MMMMKDKLSMSQINLSINGICNLQDLLQVTVINDANSIMQDATLFV